MHRVELKAGSSTAYFSSNFVPNAPCGVERYEHAKALVVVIEFLMHRVELKESPEESKTLKKYYRS
jgi:hypothetical protein